MKYIIEVSAYATELCVGTLEDGKVFEFLKNEGDGSADYYDAYEDENGDSVDIVGYEIDDIIHCYAAHTEEANINVRAVSDEEEFNEDYDAEDFASLSIQDYNYNGWFDEKKERELGTLAIYESTYTDKGLIARFELESENFNPKYLRIANIKVDEVLGTDYLLDSLFYISDEDLLKIYNKEAGEEYTLDEFKENEEDIWEFFYELCFKKHEYQPSIEKYKAANDYARSEFYRLFGDYILDGDDSGLSTDGKSTSGRLIELEDEEDEED